MPVAIFFNGLTSGRDTPYISMLGGLWALMGLIVLLALVVKRRTTAPANASRTAEIRATLTETTWRKRFDEWGMNYDEISLVTRQELDAGWNGKRGALVGRWTLIGLAVFSLLSAIPALFGPFSPLPSFSSAYFYTWGILWGGVFPLLGAFLGMLIGAHVAYARLPLDATDEQPPHTLRAYIPPRVVGLTMCYQAAFVLLFALVAVATFANYPLTGGVIGWLGAWLVSLWPVAYLLVVLILLVSAYPLVLRWLVRQRGRRFTGDEPINKRADYELRRAHLNYMILVFSLLILILVGVEPQVFTLYVAAGYAAAGALFFFGIVFALLFGSFFLMFPLLILPYLLSGPNHALAVLPYFTKPTAKLWRWLIAYNPPTWATMPVKRPNETTEAKETMDDQPTS